MRKSLSIRLLVTVHMLFAAKSVYSLHTSFAGEKTISKRSIPSRWWRGGASSSHPNSIEQHAEVADSEYDYDPVDAQIEQECPSQAELERLYPEDPIASLHVNFNRKREIIKAKAADEKEEKDRE